jgi:deoxycytidylate deaminase
VVVAVEETNPVVVNLMVNLVALEEHQVEPQEQLEVETHLPCLPLKVKMVDKETVDQHDPVVAVVVQELQAEMEQKALQE